MTTTSYIPPGFLKLRDAVDRIGQHRYGTAWTKRPSDRLEAAVDQLRGLLALGKVNAVAVAENGKVFPVESSVWLAGNGRQVFDTELLPVGNLRESLAARNHGTLRRQILVFENQLLALLKEEAEGNDTTQRQGTIAAEKKCQKWLSEMMEAGPPQKKTKAHVSSGSERAVRCREQGLQSSQGKRDYRVRQYRME